MNLLALFSGIFEPVSMIAAVAVVLISRSRWIIPVAATVAAVATEAMSAVPHLSYEFGFQLMSSLVHATVIFWIRDALFPR